MRKPKIILDSDDTDLLNPNFGKEAYNELKQIKENAELKEQIERLEKQLNKQGEQVLTMIDLLLKSYFYLSAARDCKLTLEHCGNIGILCDLINKCFKDLGK